MTTALSITLPDTIAIESQKIAQELGISRTELIRQAILHELQNIRFQREQKALAECFMAMKNHPDYLRESQNIEDTLNSQLPQEEDEWWKEKS